MVLPTEAITVTTDFEIIDAASLPTKTYYLDFKNGKCSGLVDGLKAMEQVAYKVLDTFRYKHLIYSNAYGFEPMIGYDELYVRGDLPRRIQEALLQDERFVRITNFRLEFTTKDSVTVDCTVHTIYGDVNLLREVVYSA